MTESQNRRLSPKDQAFVDAVRDRLEEMDSEPPPTVLWRGKAWTVAAIKGNLGGLGTKEHYCLTLTDPLEVCKRCATPIRTGTRHRPFNGQSACEVYVPDCKVKVAGSE